MYKIDFIKHIAVFNEPGGTSRGVLYQKPSWIIRLQHSDFEKVGFGEISIIPKLSIESEDDVDNFLKKNNQLSDNQIKDILTEATPAIRFGFEMALKSLENQALEMYGSKNPINLKTNGLVWMGNFEEMQRRAIEKYSSGFRCLKFKIGAHQFDEELNFLNSIRNKWPEIEIRLDANGAFSPHDALEKLKQLSELNIHSIEQPIKAKQWQEMAQLCIDSPIDIALDEELIGIKSKAEKEEILRTISPQYLIFKNSLIGGWKECEEWIELAEKQNVKWWSTSALELNVGLNAIAYQLTHHNNALPQGLGTGKVFTNKLPSNLVLKNDVLQKTNPEDLLYQSCLNLFDGLAN